jgi:hypothetical protein
MKSFIRIFQLLLLAGVLLLIAAAGFILGRKSNQPLFNKSEQVEAAILLEQVRNSLALVTVEGEFSEIYDYSSYWLADWSPFKKQALIRVRAKVLAGVNLEKVIFNVDELSRTITLKNVPGPHVIAVEHDLDYYDIREGSFNSFSKDEYNLLQSRAKNYVKAKAYESSLMTEAESRFNEMAGQMSIWLETIDWHLIIERSNENAHPLSEHRMQHTY